MTIKDIIIASATAIGREDIVEYLNEKNDSEELAKVVDKMTRLANLVINELACSFIPMVTSERLKAENGRVYYTSLKNNPLQILAVINDNGGNSLGEIFSHFITVKDEYVTVEYSCFPPEYELNDEIDYRENQISKRALSYGLSAEFAISEGCFKDAVLWHDRYADAVYSSCKLKNAQIKKRAWV